MQCYMKRLNKVPRDGASASEFFVSYSVAIAINKPLGHLNTACALFLCLEQVFKRLYVEGYSLPRLTFQLAVQKH